MVYKALLYCIAEVWKAYQLQLGIVFQKPLCHPACILALLFFVLHYRIWYTTEMSILILIPHYKKVLLFPMANGPTQEYNLQLCNNLQLFLA